MAKTSFCTMNGTLDDSRFNEPIPWIGLYVVAASAACALAMAIDGFHGFRYRKWFPSKFFALNATTLTLIGVAVKLAVDLNTSMPHPQDQLAKLSSTTFICTSIANSMPSLGTMETKELMSNVVALGILVVTVLVNVCIQLATGVIYEFWLEHAVIMCLMAVLFANTISTSLAIPKIKLYLDIKYNKKYKRATRECGGDCVDDTCVTTKLSDDLMKYWMMAHTCNPQFVIGRLATCSTSGALCLLSAMTLIEAILRRYLFPWSFTFCEGRSDYKWSSTLILVTHTIAIIGGTIAPACRWFIAIKFRCPPRTRLSCKSELSVEHYWTHKLRVMKEYQLNLRLHGRHARKLVHNAKNKALDLCIWFQKSIVLLSKLSRLVSVIFVSRLMIIRHGCKKLASFMRCRNSGDRNSEAETESKSSGKIDLSRFVVHLEGEEEFTVMMMECHKDVTGHLIRMGRKNQPRHLIQLLEKLKSSKGFEGVQKFDSHLVPSLESEEPPNCWALPIVTLTSIAIAIGNSEFNRVMELMRCVNEGIKYMRIIENNLDIKGDLTNAKKAAEIVWVGIDLHYRWLDVDLRGIARQGKNQREIVSELSEIAKRRFVELRKNDQLGWLRDSPSRWCIRVMAANSMYRICQSLLLTDSTLNEGSNAVLERITTIITDIMGACLTNLRHVISVKCHRSTIEEREESVRSAILLLGKTEKILDILYCHTLPSSDPEQLACINEWRELSRGKDTLLCSSSPTDSHTDCSTSSDLFLNIDPQLG